MKRVLSTLRRIQDPVINRLIGWIEREYVMVELYLIIVVVTGLYTRIPYINILLPSSVYNVLMLLIGIWMFRIRARTAFFFSIMALAIVQPILVLSGHQSLSDDVVASIYFLLCYLCILLIQEEMKES